MSNQVLIISHQAGKEWINRLALKLQNLRLVERVQVRFIEYEVGGPGEEVLEPHVRQAAVCLLLFPAHLLNSSWEAEVLPRLLDAAAVRGALLLRLTVSPLNYDQLQFLSYLGDTDPSPPLYILPAEGWSEVLEGVAQRIHKFLADREFAAAMGYTPPKETPGRAAERPRATTPTPAAAGVGAAGNKHTFVCYAREDEGFVLRLASELMGGGAAVWIDQWDIPSGADWDYEIDRALYDCRHFLIVLSPAAVESEEVRSELRTALEEGKRVVPVLYRPCRVPRRLRLIQHIDCTGAADGPGEEAVRLILGALGR